MAKKKGGIVFTFPAVSRKAPCGLSDSTRRFSFGWSRRFTSFSIREIAWEKSWVLGRHLHETSMNRGDSRACGSGLGA